MLRRTIFPLAKRSNYYRKYDIGRDATNEEIKKRVNEYTTKNTLNLGKTFGHPKAKLQVAAIYAARDQWAKFVLIKHRKSYNIYVDEKKPIKALYDALNPQKKIRIKIERVEDKKNKQTNDDSDAAELNRKLAQAQKTAWNSEQPTKFDQILSEMKTDQNKQNTNSTGESKKADSDTSSTDILKSRIIQDERFNFKSLIGLTIPAFLIASRSPFGRRFLIPALSLVMVPVGFILFYAFENNRQLSVSDQTVYNTKSVMELRAERQNNQT